jgi:hypothetical protein
MDVPYAREGDAYRFGDGSGSPVAPRIFSV